MTQRGALPAKPAQEIVTVCEKDETFTFLVTRKKVKNYNLRVKPTGELLVSVPTRTSSAQVLAFLNGHLDFVRRARVTDAPPPTALQIATGEVLPIWGVPHTLIVQKGAPKVTRGDGTLTLTLWKEEDAAARAALLWKYLKDEAKRTLTAMAEEAFTHFAPEPCEMPQLKFRTMKSRYGSCAYQKGVITLNDILVFAPPELAAYVVAHEFAHFRHPNHGAAFWAHLALHCPDCKEKRKRLRAFPFPQFAEPKKAP